MKRKALAILQILLTKNECKVDGVMKPFYDDTRRCDFCANKCKGKQAMCQDYKYDFEVAKRYVMKERFLS